MIKVENAYKVFLPDTKTKTVALNRLTFFVAPGERVSVLGPNGAGKTTLLRAITGEILLDEGVIDISANSGGRSVAFITQNINASIFSGLTLLEHLFVAKGYTGRLERRVEKELRESIQIVCPYLKDRLHDYPEFFSAGEKQLTAAAMTLFLNPKVILMDEPTVSLDHNNRELFWTLFESIRHEKLLTIILVTHDLSEAARHTQRALILHSGRLFRDVNASEHPFDAEYFRHLVFAEEA